VVTVLIAGVGILLVALVGRSFAPGKANGVITIDFNDVLTDDSAAATDTVEGLPTLRIAVAAMISPKETQRQYDDLLRLIAARLHHRAGFIQRKSYAEVNDVVERKEVDVAFVCAGPYVIGKAKFGMEILVVPVARGAKVYHSYILAHLDSPLKSLDDLRGKRFAFTDPQSNTGCLVPKYMVAQRGESPELFFGDYYYTYSHDNSIRAVAEGMADGAAVDSLIWEYLNATDPAYTARTKIIEKSPPYGIPPVVVHPDVDPDLKRQLKQVFLSLHEDQDARSILAGLRIDRFEEGDDSMYDSVREMQRRLAQTGQETP
jgi:phosphonate transport system substrate-binding protein